MKRANARPDTVTLRTTMRSVTLVVLSCAVSSCASYYAFGWGYFKPQTAFVAAKITNASVGQAHTLAVKSDGTVLAWGWTVLGILGTGSAIDGPAVTVPLPVLGLSNVRAVAAGAVHSVALKRNGTVWVWGSNTEGQLGMTVSKSCKLVSTLVQCSQIPVHLAGLSGITAISAGFLHTLALRSDGTVWAWGNNRSGALGNGSASGSSPPAKVNGITGAIAVAAGGGHSLALKGDGTVWAWGGNQAGQLGIGTTASATTPQQVTGLTGVTAVGAGDNFSIALKNDGTVWAWGGNQAGQLGGTTAETCSITPCTTIPQLVTGIAGVSALAAGYYHTLAVKTDGTVWAWGDNYYSQLGSNGGAGGSTPVQVPSLRVAVVGVSGRDHNLALLRSISPTLSIVAPTNTTYGPNQPVNASFTCTGNGAKTTSCTGTVPQGQPVDTASFGTKRFTVTAADSDGNTADMTVTYLVAYLVDIQYPTTGTWPMCAQNHPFALRIVPVSLRILDRPGSNISSSTLAVTAVDLRSSAGTVKTLNANMTYFASSSAYTYQLDITGVVDGAYDLVFSVASDPALHRVPIVIQWPNCHSQSPSPPS